MNNTSLNSSQTNRYHLLANQVDQETKVDQEDQMDPVKLIEANAGQ